ncbi:PH domain-containing protein [Fundidesulfovibrio terrae]|uniref:PH domain-containing protein n=1 Tax=Fundidesulfovibrio terrae TaxID=2922866 RepID=UPI001FAFB1CA|nr:PH domain-containing protein [Fundidesulfovibrio terrae]
MQPRRVLAEQEEILYQTKKHWAVFIKAAVYFGLAAAVLAYKDPILAAVQFTPPEDLKRILPPVINGTVKGVCFSAAVVFGLLGMARLLSFFSNKVLVTAKRVIQHDVLSGGLYSIDLKHIESVRACTGLLGSLLGYGKVIMVMGSGQKIAVANLRKPHEFERELFGAK